jgi:hypothetical protein
METIKLLNDTIQIVYDKESPSSASISSSLHSDDEYNAGIDAIESVVLAHHCSGIDVTSEGYLSGLESALESCANNID